LSIRLWGFEVGGLEVVKTKNIFPRVTTPRIRQYSCSVFGSSRFEFRPGHRLSWLRLFMVFLSPQYLQTDNTTSFHVPSK